MLRWESLPAGDGVEVARVACDGHERGWSATEPVTGFGVVLVRTGLFRRQVDGTESVLDATSGYLQWPGSEQRMAHPAGGDLCTSITLAPEQVPALTQGEQPAGDSPVFVTPALDLAHRLLLRRPSAEVAWGLAGDVLAELLPGPVAAGFPGRGRQVADQNGSLKASATWPGSRRSSASPTRRTHADGPGRGRHDSGPAAFPAQRPVAA